MLPDERGQTFAQAPLADVLSILLRQLKRPLGTQGFKLTDADANRLATERVNGAVPAGTPELSAALAGVVQESETVLAGFGLTFQTALKADMNTIGGWETTAEFLELANEKANAELRITLGAALDMAFTGNARYAQYLLYLAANDFGDETVIARRVLSFISGIPQASNHWLADIAAWLDGKQ